MGLLAPVSALANDTLGALLEALTTERAATLAFEERRDDPMLEFPEIRSGSLAFEPPDTLTRQVDGPRGETVHIEGDTLTLERRGSSREIDLNEQPALATLTGLFRALLNGDREQLEANFEIELTGDMEAWTLELVPRDRALRRMVPELTLTGAGDELRELITVESGGHQSHMRFEPPQYAD
ncbi:LolA-related protein [Thioalkalivibrio sp. ALE16]|uniref:LolA-related protein n=1 Tax=Thioalkalivibrio sp. ALE16 TaxID=1158172 RepID=UPI00039C7CC1|nr:LolA-related protein [Thioalkalivibrio sp. ALE16]